MLKCAIELCIETRSTWMTEHHDLCRLMGIMQRTSRFVLLSLVSMACTCHSSTLAPGVATGGSDLAPSSSNEVGPGEGSQPEDPLFVSTSAGAEDFGLQELSAARNAGSGGVDLGAFAVYPATVAGYNPALEPAELQVSFDSAISAAVRGEPVELMLRLSRAGASPIEVEVVPVAGDAREGEDFTVEGRTVIFEPGETAQALEVLTTGSSEHTELVAFALRPSCAQGARNVALLRILTP